MRILVIDDEAALRQVIRQMLQSAGHEVVEADNGKTGLAQFRAQPFDVVVTDIVMPEKEGTETIMEIRRLGSATRNVAISGGGRDKNQDFLKIARSLGADATLAKPFRREQLLAAINSQTAGD